MSEAERTALWFSVERPAGRVRPSGHWLVAEIARYNAAQNAIAQRHGEYFINLDARIPKELEHYFDVCYFRDVGSSQRVAEEIPPHVAAPVEVRL